MDGRDVPENGDHVRQGWQKTCLKCGEDNPPEAVMCWACYTPFNASMSLVAPEGPASALFDKCVGIGLGFGIILFILSGWVPRNFALYVIGVGVLSVAGPMLARDAWERREAKWREAKQAAFIRDADSGAWRLAPPPAELEEDLPPIIRIVNTLLFYGLKDNADIIRISVHPKGLAIEYEIEGNWHEQMKIPPYIWEDLHNRLRVMAGLEEQDSSQGEMKLLMDGRIYDVDYSEELEESIPRLVLNIPKLPTAESLAA